MLAAILGYCIVGTSAVLMTPVALADPPSPHVRSVRTTTIPAPADPWRSAVAEAVERFAIPEPWIRAVMRAGSDGKPFALSSSGAMGLMQIRPEAWAALRAAHALGDDPYEARDNIVAGTAYLRQLHDLYGSLRPALTAYHAGPERYEEYLATDFALPAETVAFVANVVDMIGNTVADPPPIVRPATPGWTEAPLFAARPTDQSDADHKTARSSSDASPRARAIVDLSALTSPSDGLFVRRAATSEEQR